MATDDKKRRIFDHYRKSLKAAGLQALSGNSVICPLCWQDADYASLSLEHIVPRKVGGKREILTCTRCNNEHGSALDSHLSQFQNVQDGFGGHGTIPAKLSAHGHTVTAKIEWGDGYKNIHIVGRASNPAEVSAIQEQFKAGNIDELNLTLPFGYIKNRFQTALLRCAYLAVFKCFGYEYAKHDVVQVIRQRICAPSLEYPRLGSLIGELRDGEIPYKDPYIIVPGNVNGVEFFLVIIQLRKETTTIHCVFMPVPVERSDEFYGIMEHCSEDYKGKMLHIPYELAFT